MRVEAMLRLAIEACVKMGTDEHLAAAAKLQAILDCWPMA